MLGSMLVWHWISCTLACQHRVLQSLLHHHEGCVNHDLLGSPPQHLPVWLSSCCPCCLQPYARKVCAALLAGLSGCVVWSSATIFTGGHPDLSPFSLMIRSGQRCEVGGHCTCLQCF
jgi:hypothetical protein